MSIATELGKLNTQRNTLAANLTTKGVTASSSETLAQLVPKVLLIDGGSAPTAVPLMHLDGINNTGTGHSDTATTWKDLFGKVADATKVTGTVNWQSNCLVLDGSTYWNVPAPNLSRRRS